MTEQEASDSLTMFSFAEILSEIDLKRTSARTNVKSWDRLHDVATEFTGASESDNSWLVGNRNWHLQQVSIHNYRGVSNENPLTLEFDPSPGITVLHGLNGAGKSSISDAIELGLTGNTSSPPRGTAGKAPLWEPIHLSRGSSSGHVAVTLTSQGQRLILETQLGPNDTVESHTACLKTADGCKTIPLDASWQEALASHQPVFAYAALERRVQLSKDLADYFEGLLALGGSFTKIHETIAARADSSHQALHRWEQARDAAMESLARIDDERRDENLQFQLDPVPEPRIHDDRKTWLEHAGLLEDGLNSKSLPSDTKTQLTDAATRVETSIRRLETAGTMSEQQLSGALEQLYAEAIDRQIDDEICPVCTTPESNWLATLEQTVERNRNISLLREGVARDTKSLAVLGETLLGEVLDISDLATIADPLMRASSIGRQRLDEFMRTRDSGTATTHASLTATLELSRWLQSHDAESLIDETVAQTDAIKQWRIARTRAVGDFISVWQTDGASAAESVLWSDTSKRVGDIRRHLREKRSASLEGKAATRVKELLSDAELELKSLNVKSTKASMELVDRNSNSVELGMLSAGQRNAVLLAPLLASIDAGPFGFLILDDPVHAFDELRVDLLAGSLAKIAETRRVIVLTHDRRLKEYLAAQTMEYDTRLVDRSAVNELVQVTDSNDFWEELLNDAGTVLRLAKKTTDSTRAVTDKVRGLCRMSIDNALRAFVIRNAVKHSRNMTSDLENLDSAYTTKGRLDAATGLWGGSSSDDPVKHAMDECRDFLNVWNKSVHGDSETDFASKFDLRAAHRACRKLVDWV